MANRVSLILVTLAGFAIGSQAVAAPPGDTSRGPSLHKAADQQRVAAAKTKESSKLLPNESVPNKSLPRESSDALYRRLASLWNPPTGYTNPDEVTVRIRIRLKPDGTLAGPPMVTTVASTPLAVRARDSALRAIFRGQPYDMLKPEHYELWNDIEVTFRPEIMPSR